MQYTDWTIHRKGDLQPLQKRTTLTVQLHEGEITVTKHGGKPIKYAIPHPLFNVSCQDFSVCCTACIPPILDIALVVAEKMDADMSKRFVAYIDENHVCQDNPGLVFAALTVFENIEWGIAREIFIKALLEVFKRDPKDLVSALSAISLAYGYANKPVKLPCTLLTDTFMYFHGEELRGERNKLLMLLVRCFSSLNRNDTVHSS